MLTSKLFARKYKKYKALKQLLVMSKFNKDLNRRLGRIVQTRQAQPWIQPELFFQMHPMSKTQQQCLETLHGFTDKVKPYSFRFSTAIRLL